MHHIQIMAWLNTFVKIKLLFYWKFSNLLKKQEKVIDSTM